jgi:hypothetical protein
MAHIFAQGELSEVGEKHGVALECYIDSDQILEQHLVPCFEKGNYTRHVQNDSTATETPTKATPHFPTNDIFLFLELALPLEILSCCLIPYRRHVKGDTPYPCVSSSWTQNSTESLHGHRSENFFDLGGSGTMDLADQKGRTCGHFLFRY